MGQDYPHFLDIRQEVRLQLASLSLAPLPPPQVPLVPPIPPPPVFYGTGPPPTVASSSGEWDICTGTSPGGLVGSMIFFSWVCTRTFDLCDHTSCLVVTFHIFLRARGSVFVIYLHWGWVQGFGVCHCLLLPLLLL